MLWREIFGGPAVCNVLIDWLFGFCGLLRFCLEWISDDSGEVELVWLFYRNALVPVHVYA